MLQISCSGNAKVTTQEKQEDQEQLSMTVRIFIEDTDCFGVVYNGNYNKFFDRARQHALGTRALAKIQKEHSLRLQLLSVPILKLSGAAVLGDELRILSTIAATSEEGEVYWEQSLLRGQDTVASGSFVTAFTDATGATFPLLSSPLASSLSCFPLLASAPSLPSSSSSSSALASREYRTEEEEEKEGGWAAIEETVWADDVDGRGSVSDVSILRAFERARSVVIGGPHQLKALQDARSLVVVTSFTNLLIDPKVTCDRLGQQVTCLTAFQRRKAKISLQQELWGEASEEGGRRLMAAAEVTCWVIDAETKRPTPPPDWAIF